ncbi:synaptonemal complex protein 2 isoform X1 [Kryptolebias marmoratus]|nr:synaptonemal complex protein 2 isoform X1 [Kryptolebias marmoratus]
MVQWFEKCQELWIHHGPHWDETMFTLSENFLNALMVVHESCKEGTYKVTESFLYPVGQLAVDPRVYILIQKEAIRKYNLILDKIPVEFKKNRRILTSQEGSDIMTKLAARILEGGDYDLQSSLMEALCRMATPAQRRKLADRWFSMAHVASAFAQISDSEFETACRRFLNMVNGMQGDKRRVYSYPCLEVYLGKYELLMPADEKLEEFWVDFNLCSHSISFYFSLPDEEDGHWETMCISENEVQSYTVKEEGKSQVLQIKLSEVVVVGAVEGSNLTVHFSSSLNIVQAAQKVYGLMKSQRAPVVKTAGKTMIEENNTQVVPESQVSLGESEKTTAPYVLSAPAAPAQMVTPARMRMSESTAYISTSEGGSVYSISSLPKLSTKDKDKTSLEKICSRDTNTTPSNTNAVGTKEQKMAEAEHVVVPGQAEEKCQEHYFIPDTQPKAGLNTSSSWSKFSVSEMLMMPTQKIGSLPRPESNSSVVEQLERCPSSSRKLSISNSSLVLQKQLHSELTQRLQQVLNERNEDPQYEAAPALQKKPSNARRNSKDRSSESMRDSALYTPQVQQLQTNDQRKGESKGQTSQRADAVSTNSSLKTSATKTVQEKKESKNKDETNTALSSKDKRDAKVTASMMKRISSHYEVNTRSAAKGSIENTAQNWIPPLVNRPIFNLKVFSSGKKEMPKAVSPRKSFNKTTKKPVAQRKDIFAFNIDSPFCIGGENKIFNKTLNTSNSGIQSSPTRLSPDKKAQLELAAKNKRYVKKHLFSDTDTDNALTEVSWLRESARKSKPQVTKYPRQALSKPKAVPPPSSRKSTDVLPASPKAAKGSKPSKMQDQPKTVKESAAPSRPQAAGRRPKRAAAASTKSYLEPDTDDSQSETEGRHAFKHLSTDKLKNDVKIQEATQTKKKMTAGRQPTKMMLQSASEMPTITETCHAGKQENSEKICSEDPQVKRRKTLSDLSAESCRRQDSHNQSDLKRQSDLKVKLGKVVQAPSKLNKKNVIRAQEQMSALKDSLAACQTSFCPSPPFIEKMRSAERSPPALHLTCSTVLTPWGSPLSASPKPPRQETPSPVPLLPKPHSTVSSKRKGKPPSFYKAEKNYSSSKAEFIQSVPSPCSSKGQTPAPGSPAGPSSAEMYADQQHLSSAPRALLSPSTQPLLTSTLLELDKPPVASPSSSPIPEDTVSYSCHLDFSKVSSGSLASLSHSSPKSSVLSPKIKNSSSAPMTESLKSEKTPVKDRDLELPQSLISGPSRKRHVSLSSNSEEDEKENKKKSKIKAQRLPRMKPRKLFKSFAEVSAVEELSHMSSSKWEVEVVDGDVDMEDDLELPEMSLNPNNLCQQMSSELKNKFQNRCKMMEIYNKQSLKTVHQHVSSINVQLTKYRTQKLEQVQKVLLDEIHNMEQDDSMLKNMEKDLTLMWKKQITAFHSYQKQQIRRNDTLKNTLQSNVHQSLEYEEGIFTSEMGLIRNDMKSVQDRLLNEMLEGEVQSVKRGLRALFFH